MLKKLMRRLNTLSYNSVNNYAYDDMYYEALLIDNGIANRSKLIDIEKTLSKVEYLVRVGIKKRFYDKRFHLIQLFGELESHIPMFNAEQVERYMDIYDEAETQIFNI